MYIYIVNPIAGDGRAKRIHTRLMELEEYKNQKSMHFYTKYKGHAEKLIAHIIKKYGSTIHVVVVIGGDGTMHEVVNGMKGNQIPVTLIAGGSGNDFARGARISKHPTTVLENIIKHKKTADYWIGNYIEKGKRKRSYVNCIGFGFDAVVAERANRSRLKRLFNKLLLGSIIYVFALLQELFLFHPISLTIETENIKRTVSRCFLLTINNHVYFGGGMKINPHASNNNEHFSILVVDSISRWKVLLVFLTVFTGKHIHFKEVSTIQAKQIKIYAEDSIPVQIDGEP